MGTGYRVRAAGATTGRRFDVELNPLHALAIYPSSVPTFIVTNWPELAAPDTSARRMLATRCTHKPVRSGNW